MQEIESGIYYEDAFPGVTLGALTLPRGTILIDAPLRAEDGRSWRAALLNRGSGIDRVLINLDAHPDRTIGARSLECTVVAHEQVAEVFNNRAPTFKWHQLEVGAEWELVADLGSSRWAMPDMIFTERMYFHWGVPDIHLEYHPGPAPGASWVVIPESRLAFIGDAVVVDQPPFLAEADISAWVETLDLLLSSRYRSYVLISGRGGPATVSDIRKLRSLLKKIDKKITAMQEKSAPVAEVAKLIPIVLEEYDYPKNRAEFYEQRVRHGLERYYNRNTQIEEELAVEEE